MTAPGIADELNDPFAVLLLRNGVFRTRVHKVLAGTLPRRAATRSGTPDELRGCG